MKTYTLRSVLILLLVIAGNAAFQISAQTIAKEQAVQVQLQKMTEFYGLNDAQKNALKPILSKQFELRQSIKKSSAKLGSEEMKKMINDYKNCDLEIEDKLTPEQKEKAEKKRKELKIKVKKIEGDSRIKK